MAVQFDPSQPFEVVEEETLDSLTAPRVRPPVVVAPAVADPTFDPSQPFTVVPEATAPAGPVFNPNAPVQKIFSIEDFASKSVDELVADKDYQPVNFGVQNKDALLADPELQSKQEQVYRARETAGTTAMDKLRAAKKGALPGLQLLFSGVGQAIKTGAKLGGAGITIPAINALKALTGPEGSGAAYVKDLGKSGAELASSVELASLGTADLLRRSARELGESKLAPINPVNIALRAGNKPKAEQTEGDWRNRYFNDVELAQKVEEAGRGSAEVMKLVGIDADTLQAEHGITLDPQVISELSVVTNPINYIPVGAVVGAVTSVGGKLVTRGLAAAKSAAQASEFAGILNKAAEVAATAKSVGSGVTGGTLKALGGAVEATGDAAQAAIRTVLPRGAQYGVGLGSLLGGNVYKALGGLAVVKGIPKALQVGGSALKRAGAVVAGEAELPGAISLAGQTAKQATLGGLQAGVEGTIISLPFEIGARPEEEEQILGFVPIGAAAGAGIRGARPGVKATGRAAQNKLAETIFQHIEQADAPETPRYEGAPDALNNAHEINYAKLSPSDKKLVNWGRRLAPAEDLQIFALDSAGMLAETARREPSGGSATAKGYAIKIADRTLPDGTTKPVVHIYLNADAQALPHEFFHALEILDPKPAKALVEAGKKALTPAQFKGFEQYYNTLLNDRLPEKFWKKRLTKDEVYREVAAEGFSRTFLAQDLSGVAPAVRQKAALFVSSILEKLGAPLAGVNLKKGTPGASTLGVRPGTESVKLGQQWLGDILARVNDDGTLSVTPTKAKEAPITVAEVKPSILSVEDLEVATALRKNQVSDKAIARHFGLTEADVVKVLGVGPTKAPVPVLPRPQPTPSPAAPPSVPPPNTPIAPPSPAAAPRNIRTTRTTPRDTAGERSQVTGIEEAKASAAATGDANTVARVNELADLLNQPVEIVHSGAKAAGTVEAPSGRTARRAEIASGGVREKYSKVTIPDRWVVVAGKPQLLAFSLDKIFTNMDTLAAKAAEKGVSEKIPYPTEAGKFSEATSELILDGVSAYAENQRNGRKGDGTPLTRPTEEIGISIPPENPDYVPRKLADDAVLAEQRMNFINALMGTDPFVPRTARETPGQVPGNVKGQIVAEVNKRKPQKPSVVRPEDISKQDFKSYPGRSIAEMNPLRDELAAAGVPMRELLDANERIFAKDISQVVARPDLEIQRPVTDTIRGGFLPDSKFSNAADPIVSPAISDGDGIHTGPFHSSITSASEDGISGFVTRSGRFLDRDEAFNHAKKIGQIDQATPKSSGGLDSFEFERNRNFLPPEGNFLPGDTAKQISDVLAMSPDEFMAAAKSWDGGLTGQAIKVGLEVKSLDDVTALRASQADATAKARERMKVGSWDAAGSWASQSQFFREAAEASTGTGGIGESLRKDMGDAYVPPFPEAKPVGAFQPAPAFYSELQRVIDEKVKGESIPATQLAALVRNAGVKPEELKWSGLDDYLAGKSKVSVPELKKFLRENEVQLEEVVKSQRQNESQYSWDETTGDEGPREWELHNSETGERAASIVLREGKYAVYRGDSGGKVGTFFSLESAMNLGDEYKSKEPASWGTKFQNYQVPGGLNYRELLLTLPEMSSGARKTWEAYRDELFSKYKTESQIELQKKATEAEFNSLQELGEKLGNDRFQSSHFDEPNVLAHVRFNERLDAEGGRVLFLEEVQSDWHQKGKKEGYASGIKAEVATELPEGTKFEVRSDRFFVRTPETGSQFIGEGRTREAAAVEGLRALNYIRGRQVEGGVPDAPFKKTWPLLAVKRMIRYAAENDFDKVAWTPGDVQAARYDLSRHVDSITVKKNVNDEGYHVVGDKGGVSVVAKGPISREAIADYAGKELAEKALTKLDGYEASDNPSRVYVGATFSGLDLKVGGEGMRGFYDQILPKEVGAYVKKWGAKVEKTRVEAAEEGNLGSVPTISVWSVELTPSMRSDVLTKGQKMFLPKSRGTAPSISPSEVTPRSPTVLPPLSPDDLEKRR